MISTRRSPKQPVRAQDHEHDQHDAEHDVARRVRLGEQDVLPHERAEVERRHERDVAPASRASSVSASTRQIEADVRDRADPVREVRRDDDPVRERVVEAVRRGPRVPVGVDRIRPSRARRSRTRRGCRAAIASLRVRPKANTRASTPNDVEEDARIARIAQQLEHHADDHRADVTPGEVALAAEDDHRVDGDQQREREREREHAALQRREERAGERRDGGAEAERHQLEQVDRHAHRLGRERVLAQRAPGAAGARVVDEVQRDVDDREEGERDVEVGDGEDALVLRPRASWPKIVEADRC